MRVLVLICVNVQQGSGEGFDERTAHACMAPVVAMMAAVAVDLASGQQVSCLFSCAALQTTPAPNIALTDPIQCSHPCHGNQESASVSICYVLSSLRSAACFSTFLHTDWGADNSSLSKLWHTCRWGWQPWAAAQEQPFRHRPGSPVSPAACHSGAMCQLHRCMPVGLVCLARQHPALDSSHHWSHTIDKRHYCAISELGEGAQVGKDIAHAPAARCVT